MNKGGEHSAAPLEGADDNQAPLVRYLAGSQALRKLMLARGADTNNIVSSRQSSLNDHFYVQYLIIIIIPRVQLILHFSHITFHIMIKIVCLYRIVRTH